MAHNCYNVERVKADSDFPVFGIPGLGYVAEAVTRSERSKAWNIIDAETHAFQCQVRGRTEMTTWLTNMARNDGVPFNATF